jgi:hypothetical protein
MECLHVHCIHNYQEVPFANSVRSQWKTKLSSILTLTNLTRKSNILICVSSKIFCTERWGVYYLIQIYLKEKLRTGITVVNLLTDQFPTACVMVGASSMEDGQKKEINNL